MICSNMFAVPATGSSSQQSQIYFRTQVLKVPFHSALGTLLKMSYPTAATPVGPCNEQYMTCATAGPVPVNIAEYEKHAMSKLPKNAFDYYASGANDMITLRENRAAFSRLRLMPKILVDVSSLNTETTVLGDKVSSPICIAPSAMQKMAHPDGNISISVRYYTFSVFDQPHSYFWEEIVSVVELKIS